MRSSRGGNGPDNSGPEMGDGAHECYFFLPLMFHFEILGPHFGHILGVPLLDAQNGSFNLTASLVSQCCQLSDFF